MSFSVFVFVSFIDSIFTSPSVSINRSVLCLSLPPTIFLSLPVCVPCLSLNRCLSCFLPLSIYDLCVNLLFFLFVSMVDSVFISPSVTIIASLLVFFCLCLSLCLCFYLHICVCVCCCPCIYLSLCFSPLQLTIILLLYFQAGNRNQAHSLK